MSNLHSTIIEQIHNAGITHVISVPDGYLAPMIQKVEADATLHHTPAAREEEALAIASGLVMAGKKVIVLMQNSGFLNSIGCFSTLCQNYRTGFVLLLANRGNLFDKNSYDIPKIRYMDGLLQSMNLLNYSCHQYRDEANLVGLAQSVAETAGEPALLLLDYPPQHSAC